MEISLKQLSEIFSSAFEEKVELNMESGKENLKQWDSLKHLHLILELEEQLNVRFNTEEIERMTNVEQIISVLKQKE
jgi:acyl carrier protein